MPRKLKLLHAACAPAALARQGAATPDPQFEHAVAVYRKGDSEGAVKELRSVTKRRADDPLAWVYLGQALTRRGELKDARHADVSGVVRLRAVLGADGAARHVIVLGRLSHGLTEKAVKAARQIKFKPATLGGRPVSRFVVLEYNFNSY